jgi:hypothetical protein
MPHSIILTKNRDLIKAGADGSVELTEIHEAFDAMEEGSAKTAAATLLDNFQDSVCDFTSDYCGQIDAIKTAVGL